MLSTAVRLLIDVRRAARFTREYAAFRGVYPDFQAAIRASPDVKPLGYDHDHLATEYLHSNTDEAESYDYPMMFHLRTALEGGARTVFDFGGNTGIHMYTFRRYLDLPGDLTWTVCELPALVRAGEQLARQRRESCLRFTTDMQRASGADLLLSSGAVQYLEEPTLAEYLSGLIEPPHHLLLNRLPLCDGPGFATLQNGGSVFYPQRVFNRTEFLNALRGVGYEVVDTWRDHVDVCHIPFHRDRSLSFYSGVYCRRSAVPAAPVSESGEGATEGSPPAQARHRSSANTRGM